MGADRHQELGIGVSAIWSSLCDRFGIDSPIFGFAHDIETVAAITNAGGFGVYGATRRFPEEITQELTQIRSLVGNRPFGVDLVLPPGMPEHNSREAIQAEIPQEHTAFVQQLIDYFEVPKASKPGMRTRFIRSKEIEQAQLRAVMESDVDMLACGIGAPADAVAEAKLPEEAIKVVSCVDMLFLGFRSGCRGETFCLQTFGCLCKTFFRLNERAFESLEVSL